MMKRACAFASAAGGKKGTFAAARHLDKNHGINGRQTSFRQVNMCKTEHVQDMLDAVLRLNMRRPGTISSMSTSSCAFRHSANIYIAPRAKQCSRTVAVALYIAPRAKQCSRALHTPYGPRALLLPSGQYT